jgi:hypothetical protein
LLRSSVDFHQFSMICEAFVEQQINFSSNSISLFVHFLPQTPTELNERSKFMNEISSRCEFAKTLYRSDIQEIDKRSNL